MYDNIIQNYTKIVTLIIICKSCYYFIKYKVKHKNEQTGHYTYYYLIKILQEYF